MIGQQTPPIVPIIVGRGEQRWRAPVVCVALATITFAVFGQTAGFGFVNYDDDKYVYENPVVQRGLTLKGFFWALTDDKTDHWHPLTWLTHMADCQVYGPWAGGHHLTNVALHTLAVVLLFLALKEMTGCLWRSAFVAAVFAIHPLRAESVAWIAERKDVLSGVFFMLTLWAYARYARQPSRGRYAAVVVAYGLGLLCKNTLVTLPFVLLLLDWWPFQRTMPDGAGGGRVKAPFWGLVREKIPLFLLSAGSCVVTVLAPQQVVGSGRIPFLDRLGNAVVSYGVYLWQMVFPAGLAIPCLYPPNGQPLWKVVLILVLLAAISMGVLVCWKKRPYLLMGWLWYLGMLVPAIGIVQISYHAHADRFTYLPGIGLVLAMTWLVAEWRMSRVALGALMAGVLALLMVCAWQQTAYWQNSETLWSGALACTTDNYIAQNNFGFVLMQKGRMDAAIACFQQALQIQPGYADARNNLGHALLHMGKVDEAITCFQQALQISPDFADARNNLGLALFQKGRVDEAITHFRGALQIKPDDANALNNLGDALLRQGKADEAINCFQQALQIKPDFAEAHDNLGNSLLQTGKVDEAIIHCQRALQLKPDDAEACVNLGNALFRKGRVDDAIAQYQKALQINPGLAMARKNLDAVLRQVPGRQAIPEARGNDN
jgi:tetratricopeptide (TPR) repeat protein